MAENPYREVAEKLMESDWYKSKRDFADIISRAMQMTAEETVSECVEVVERYWGKGSGDGLRKKVTANIVGGRLLAHLDKGKETR